MICTTEWLVNSVTFAAMVSIAAAAFIGTWVGWHYGNQSAEPVEVVEPRVAEWAKKAGVTPKELEDFRLHYPGVYQAIDWGNGE